MFSSASGSAASLDAVENAIRNGPRAAVANRPTGMRAIATTAPSTTTTKKISAAHNVATNFPSPSSTFHPCSPTVDAIAPNTPSGATHIT